MDARAALQHAARLLAVPSGVPTLRAALEHQVTSVRAALRDRDPQLAVLAGPDGLPPEREAGALVARHHGFASWDDALAVGDRAFDSDFEAAADAIVAGDRATVRTLLAARPELAHQRSPYRHRATLLHHVAANGIEMTRQWQSPANACEIAQALLDAGAEPDALCDAYGSDTTLTLLVSSCHPAAAGVQADLVETLVRGGARIDGIDDDGAPLWTAITWGYQLAVDRLVALGARVDNLIFAAATGDVERTRAALATPQKPFQLAHGPALDPARMLDYATIYAAGLGRTAVVELLLAHHPDLTLEDPVHGATALGFATYPHADAGRPDGNADVAALLRAASP